jgi:predicted porin
MFMKRILVLAATTVVAGAALAQSTPITIYGRANVTVERQKLNGATTTALVNNASRIGFKGTEDLGGGLKAGFILEHGWNIDTGLPSGSFWGRQSEVNLSSGFGMLRMGTYTSEAYFATADYISMHNHDTGPSSDALYAYLGRNVNKVAYRTPSMGGATVEAAMSLKENGTNHTYDLAANWQGGPLHLGAGYEKNGSANQFAVRGLLEMGAVTVGAYVQRDKNGWAANAGSRTTVRLSAMYAMGKAELHANVGVAGKYSKIADSEANQLTLGYNYNLSKRTKVYGYYTRVDDDKKLYTGGDFSSYAIGLRHNF